MKNIYLEFCSVIYHFYVRKNDNTPAMYAFWASTAMLFANAFTLYGCLLEFTKLNLPSINDIVYYLIGFICIVNYFSVFKHAKYKEMIPRKNSGILAVLYIILSIVFVIWISNKHRDGILNENNKKLSNISLVYSSEENDII